MLKPWDRICRVAVHYKGGGGSSGPVITEDMVEQARVSVDQWNTYVTDHLPMIKTYIAEKTDTGKQDAIEQGLRGKLNADIAQRTAMKSIPAGVNPGQSLMAQGLNRDIAGKNAALGSVEVTQNYGDRKIQELGNIVGAGRGQKVEAMEGLNQLAASSAESAIIKAKADQQARFANEAATAKMIGAGLNAATTVGMYGADQGWFSSKPDIMGSQTIQSGGMTYRAPTTLSGGMYATGKP